MKLSDYYETNYPTHDRLSCSDENPINAAPDACGCRRCNAILFTEHAQLKAAYKDGDVHGALRTHLALEHWRNVLTGLCPSPPTDAAHAGRMVRERIKDTPRLDFIAVRGRAVRDAYEVRQNLLVWHRDTPFPHDRKANLRSVLDEVMKR